MQNLLDYILSISNNQWYVVYLIVIIISYLMYLVTRHIVLKSISHFFKKTSTNLDDILIEKGVFNRLSYLVPLIFIYNLKDLLPAGYQIVDRILVTLIALIFISAINAFINALSDIYSKSRYSDRLNIKSYIQIIKLFVNIFGIIIVIALLTGKSPVYFLSGIGALTAVLMLVFKDTILSRLAPITYLKLETGLRLLSLVRMEMLLILPCIQLKSKIGIKRLVLSRPISLLILPLRIGRGWLIAEGDG